MGLLLVMLQFTEQIPVTALEILLLTEHDEFFLIDNIIDIFFIEFVIVSHLIAHHALTSFVFLSV